MLLRRLGLGIGGVVSLVVGGDSLGLFYLEGLCVSLCVSLGCPLFLRLRGTGLMGLVLLRWRCGLT